MISLLSFLLLLLSGIVVFTQVSSQSCPTGTCPLEDTCCSTDSGYSCCPYASANCCNDNSHCCPNGYTCDVELGRCVHNFEEMEMTRLEMRVEADCPADTCPSAETCCTLGGGQWGCCPFASATCCSDDAHCCPMGYTCDTARSECIKNLKGNLQARSYFAEIIKRPQDSCPVNTCPPSDTCCSLGSGQFGCCPMVDADCCTDNAHCCPKGYTCDIAKSQCVQSFEGKLLSHTPIVPIRNLQDVCPVGTCPSNETCCSLGSGQFGCCPYVKAVCCTDQTHCCPDQYTCDLSTGACTKSLGGDSNLIEIGYLAAIDTPIDTCPVGTCPSSETCCDIGGGQFGCCPFEGADCCTDKQHCCPAQYKCDITVGQCVKSVEGRGMVHVDMMDLKEKQKGPLACTCPLSDTTCCPTEGGAWACCPYVLAECCADHVNCCPNGYICDLQSQNCVHKWTKYQIGMAPVIN